MDPLVLLRDARAAGLAVTADDDGQLVVRGPLRLAALAEAVLAEKAAVLAALRAEAAAITVADVAAIFGARVIRGAPPGLRCGVCGGGDWRPAAGGSWVECRSCAAQYPPRAAPEWRDAAGVDYAVLC